VSPRVLEYLCGDGTAQVKSGARHYNAALALAGELRLLSSPTGHLGLGKLHRQTGKRIESDEHLTSATTMYREMGMTYWLEKAEAEINNVD
jgi:hypothetical protein